MVLFELLQLARVFLYYLRIEYLWHALIMPLTNRNGIIWESFMGIVLLDMAMSLDGFVADQHGNALYPIDELRNTEALDELIETTGAVVMGRRAYDMAEGDFTEYEYQVPVFVLRASVNRLATFHT